MATLSVDNWTAACVDRLSDITSPEMMTMAELWILADTLWEANAHRDPIEVADEWDHGSGRAPRNWPGRGSQASPAKAMRWPRNEPEMPRTEEEAAQDLVEASKEYHALIMQAIEGRIVPRSDIGAAFQKLAAAHDAWAEASMSPSA